MDCLIGLCYGNQEIIFIATIFFIEPLNILNSSINENIINCMLSKSADIDNPRLKIGISKRIIYKRRYNSFKNVIIKNSTIQDVNKTKAIYAIPLNLRYRN